MVCLRNDDDVDQMLNEERGGREIYKKPELQRFKLAPPPTVRLLASGYASFVASLRRTSKKSAMFSVVLVMEKWF